MKHIVSIATDWGTNHGGINAFNYDFCRALSKYAKVTCLIISKDEITADVEPSITVLKFDKKATIANIVGSQQMHEIGSVDIVIGHDIVTGALAAGLAEYYGTKLSLFHHMAYRFYHSIKSNDANASDRKVTQQRELFDGRENVFGIGPKLQRSAESLVGGKSVESIIPGLVDISPREYANENLSLIFFGRLGPKDAVLKQSELAARAFGRAVRRMDTRVRAQKFIDCELTLLGLDENDSKTALKLRNIASQEAERAVSVNPISYDTDRERLMQRLSHATACLMLSVHEGFGLVGWEAIGAGIPLIISKATGLHELLVAEGLDRYTEAVDVRGQFAGQEITTNKDDVEVVSEAILGICFNSTDYKTQSLELHKKLVERGYTWSGAALRWMKSVNLLPETSGKLEFDTHWVGTTALDIVRQKKIAISTGDLGRLKAALSDGSIAAIHGMGGVGKSTIVKEFLRLHQTEYDTIFWIDCSNLGTAPQAIDPVVRFCVLNEISSPNCSTLEQAVDAISKYISKREKDVVIVLDNVSQDLNWVSSVTNLDAHCIITTRDRFLAEQFSPVELGIWDDDRSNAYLLDHLTDRVSERQGIQTLVGRLGGLPIALNHAVHFLQQRKLISTQTYSAHLDYWLDRLPSHLKKERTVFATVMVSVEELAKAYPFAPDLLSVLSSFAPVPIPLFVFTDPSSFDRSEIPSPEWQNQIRTEDLLGALHNYHLVDFDALSSSLKVHELVAQCLRWSFSDTQNRAVEIAIKLVAGVYPRDEDSPAKSHTLPRCEALNPHAMHLLFTAEESAVSSSDALSLLNQTAIFYLTYFKHTEANRLVDKLLSASRHTSSGTIIERLRGLNMSAELLRREGDSAAALRKQIEVIRLVRKTNDPVIFKSLPVYLGNLAYTLSDRKKPRWSVCFEREKLRLLDTSETPDWLEVSRCYSNLAMHYLDYRDFESTERSLIAADESFRRTNQPDSTIKIATLVGWIRLCSETGDEKRIAQFLRSLQEETEKFDHEAYFEYLRQVEARVSELVGYDWCVSMHGN